MRTKVSLTSTLKVNFKIRANKQKPHFEWEIFFESKKNFPNRRKQQSAELLIDA